MGVPRRIQVGPALADATLREDTERADAPIGPPSVEHDRSAGRPRLPRGQDGPQDFWAVAADDDQAIRVRHGRLLSRQRAKPRNAR
jgi:hypothetical protein